MIREENEKANAIDRVAVYWDIENMGIPLKTKSNVFDEIMKYIKSLGPVMINKAYADWNKMVPYSEEILKAGIDALQLFPHALNKNSADMSLTCDALTDVFNYDPDIIVLLTGDSDYIPLVKALKKLKKYVICIGGSASVARHLIDTCDKFIYLKTIISDNENSENKTQVSDEKKYKETETEKSTKEIKEIKVLMTTAFKFLEEQTNKEQFVLPQIKEMLVKLDPSFSPKNYGHSKLKDFLESCSFIEMGKDENSQFVGKLKKKALKS
jgi:uncharacterized protein (TIGR00288 family)